MRTLTRITLVTLIASLAPALAAAESSKGVELPDDVRLTASRAELEALVTRLGADGLPADMVVAKVREGLAKNVPVARILVVARKLGLELAEMSTLASGSLGLRGADRPPPGLIKALSQAKSSGAKDKDLERVLKRVGAKDRERALATLADLATRGYPSGGASEVVAQLGSGKDGGKKLGKVVRAIEAFRNAEGLTPGEALEAISAAIAAGEGLDKAIKGASSQAARGKALGKSQKPPKPGKSSK